MSALSVRTIRRLDERSETREVRGVRIDKDIPLPPRLVGKIDSVLSSLEVGESFEHTARIGSRSKVRGRKFTQRQVGPKKWRIWRIA